MFILLAGQIAVGKSSVAREIVTRTGGILSSARSALTESIPLGHPTRRSLQILGQSLDDKTNGSWLFEYVASRHEPEATHVVDSVRTMAQVNAFAEADEFSYLVYLAASVETRRARYSRALGSDPLKAKGAFDTSSDDHLEQRVGRLQPRADLVVPTDHMTPSEVCRRIVEQLHD